MPIEISPPEFRQKRKPKPARIPPRTPHPRGRNRIPYLATISSDESGGVRSELLFKKGSRKYQFMKNSIFIFHGTEGYPEENWFPWMKKELEQKGYKVFVPQFPSPPIVPAKIEEWLDVLKNYDKYIDENAILIGHSLGGVFTLRILEKLGHSVMAAFFIGTPIGIRPIANYDRDNSFSGFTFDWKNIKKKARYFGVFQSDDDPYVGLENGKELAKNLGVELAFVPNAGHFNKTAGYVKFEKLRDEILGILNIGA